MKAKGKSGDQGGLGRGYRPVLIGVLSGIVVSAALLLLFSVILSMRDIPQSAIDPMAIFALSVGGFVAGFVCVRQTRGGGLIYGACCGLLYSAVILLAGMIAGAGGIGVPALFRAVFVLLCAMIGGVLGVNVRGRRR